MNDRYVAPVGREARISDRDGRPIGTFQIAFWSPDSPVLMANDGLFTSAINVESGAAVWARDSLVETVDPYGDDVLGRSGNELFDVVTGGTRCQLPFTNAIFLQTPTAS